MLLLRDLQPVCAKGKLSVFSGRYPRYSRFQAPPPVFWASPFFFFFCYVEAVCCTGKLVLILSNPESNTAPEISLIFTIETVFRFLMSLQYDDNSRVGHTYELGGL